MKTLHPLRYVQVCFMCLSASSCCAEDIQSVLSTLGDNMWIKIPVPANHPITRSAAPVMHYIPETHEALLWGCSHGDNHNDLWSYNLSMQSWKELLPTEESILKDVNVLKLKDGLVMTREERPLSMHQWGSMAYDPDRKVLWHVPVLGWQGSAEMNSISYWYQNPDWKFPLPFTREEYLKSTAKLKGTYLWNYSPKQNKWSWVSTEDPAKLLEGMNGHWGTFRYFPPDKKLYMMATSWTDFDQVRVFDPETKRWSAMKVKLKALEDVKGKTVSPCVPVLYDEKDKCFILIEGSGTCIGTWKLEPQTQSFEQLCAGIKTPPSNLDGPQGVYVYDSIHGTVLGIFVSKFYDADKALKDKSYPSDRPLVMALDTQKKEWDVLPPSANNKAPVYDTRCVHTYFDPEHNVVVVYMGGYNSPATEMWLYRYKQAKK